MSNIYNSFANVVKVTSELSALQQSARDLFQAPEGFGLSSFAWTPHEKFAEHEWVCVWAAIGATVFSEGQKKNRPIGRLLLCMDLFRQTSPAITRTVLPHSTESFLTCVFIAGNNVNDKTYDPVSLQFTTDGWPIHADLFVAHEGGRLIQYLEPEEQDITDWTKRAWLFAVPLSAMPNRDQFRKELVAPFWSAIANKSPGTIFPESSAACRFPLARSSVG
ncbi:hypothetical protein ABIF65_002176 [Bradyrhizobium japonicum]|uniref:Uncharacterized protein n=1 Tax=Bradyrhizobium barranii subsp. barranii TaxID=2823807 RepID=A0A939MA13_9BRAD|nr:MULTISPECIES: hypothetical protein [Bradyrhizobium]MBR0879340.1 hypothetical protein [Bradyrhizobium liaoningense]MBR1004472.1 hypothetical protein [Bradyrhizobium liaoningense]MBR1069543.1 hypothetical protein [Bradyrhizobium liaoningense]MCP1740674.1 hypothetical protein [Bradyrhizobium japonicum]MCP1779028.1 hypothetical protein [Bradyrhizobium japonicum]